MNNNIGCIEGHVILLLRRWELMSLWRHIQRHFSKWRTSTYRNITHPMLKSNAGDQRVCKKKNPSWLFGADRKIYPSVSLFGFTLRSLVMPNSDPRMDLSIHTSHPWKVFIIPSTWLLIPSTWPTYPIHLTTIQCFLACFVEQNVFQKEASYWQSLCHRTF